MSKIRNTGISSHVNKHVGLWGQCHQAGPAFRGVACQLTLNYEQFGLHLGFRILLR